MTFKSLLRCKTSTIMTNNPSLQISLVKLDRNNYIAGSKSCLLFIKAHGLQGVYHWFCEKTYTH